jgi:hypothetical protein
MMEMPVNMTLKAVLMKIRKENHPQGHLQGHPDLDLALPQRQAHLLHHLQGQDQDHLQHQKKIEKEAGSLGQGNGNGSKGYIGKG